MKKYLIILTIALFGLEMQVVAKDTSTYISDEYVAICEEIGDIYNICPELLIAIIEIESSGNAKAKNGECKGLMQVSEKWHKERMEKLGVYDLYEPYGNVLVASDYLLELFEKYSDIGLVLMVYNGTSNAEIKANNCEFSKYAEKIMSRSMELEEMRKKVISY